MEFETYSDVIDAFERDNMGYDTLTDYIKGENIKIKEIEMSPLDDLKNTMGSRDQDSGIMGTDDAEMMMAEANMQMAEDPFLREEYEKYRYDMLEQGLEPMTFEQFRREALAGMARSQPKEVEEVKEEKVISLAQGGIASLLGA
tara:strand:- start:6 stop:437 length:432 start_codon:yes stop_codon:yes gene_type:complete